MSISETLVPSQKLVATDLDGTLIPSRGAVDDGSQAVLADAVHQEGLKMSFVTGRNLRLIAEGYRTGQIRRELRPDLIIAAVGSQLFVPERGKLRLCQDHQDFLRRETRNWDPASFRVALQDSGLAGIGLKLQPIQLQNEFKLSYFIDFEAAKAAEAIEAAVQKALLDKTGCQDAKVIVSRTTRFGLLDILSIHGSKASALKIGADLLGISAANLHFSGDSGNDLDALTAGFPATLVANAHEEVKERVISAAAGSTSEKLLYLAKGRGRLSGRFASGIIEGLIHFGFIGEKWSQDQRIAVSAKAV